MNPGLVGVGKTKIALISGFVAGVLVAFSATLIAGSVTLPHTFTTGSTAKASEVNNNFNAVKTAVDDNNNRITTIESTVNGGNIVLQPSTANSGNILRGAESFIHNFGTSNTFVGRLAGNFTMTGTHNAAIGEQALPVNTTGLGNIAIGTRTLFSNTVGDENIAIGGDTLLVNTTGSNNIATGGSALGRNTTGSNNTANGRAALFQNTTGTNNTASGNNALRNNTTGINNTATGSSALQNSTGSSNIGIGSLAGNSLTTGDNNIYIGNNGTAVESATIRIGQAIDRTFVDGIFGVTSASGIAVLVNNAGQLGTTTSSRRYKDDVRDMGDASSALMKLRPVTFRYKGKHDDGTRLLQYGLVAEEVAAVVPGLVASGADGSAQSVRYNFLAPMLLNEYQKQQRTIAAQAARIAELERQALEIAELKRQVGRMASLLARFEPERTAAAGR